MPKRPPDPRQPPLFPPDITDSPEPAKPVHSKTEGGHHAIQDDRSRAPARADGAARATAADPPPETDARHLRPGAEGQPRSLEGTPVAGEAGQRPEPDSERSAGNGPAGTAGSFALRTGRRERPAFARPGDGPYQNSYVARLKASRGQPSLFDAPPQQPASDDGSLAAPVPHGAKTDGTLISPPGRASGIPVRPEGLPQNPAGTEARRAEPRTG